MKVLLFGRTGQVATEIRRLAGPDLAVTALGRAEADLSDLDACAAAIAGSDVDAVINAAAYTAVDAAETDEVAAHVVNAEAPGAMARAAAARGLPFLHVSSDYIFDGSGTQPWREGDAPAPLSAYGRTKLAGEQAVAAAGGVHVILRTAWVFAGHGGNFVATMLRVGRERDRLTVVDDQVGGPTPASAIAAALGHHGARAWRRGRGRTRRRRGSSTLQGTPAVSWCGFAREIFARPPAWERVPGGRPDPDGGLAGAWPPGPPTRVLDCARIERAWGIARPDWRDGPRPRSRRIAGR